VTGYILDASVAAKWFLPSNGEPLAAESSRLLEDLSKGLIHISVPDLFWPELGNVLWKSARSGRISQQTALEAVIALEDLKIPTVSTAGLLPDALSIAFSFQRTVYDSIYVALAAASGQVLVTADERLANATAAYFPVRWLGSIV
jgi:predicted nucleic acid-binding protein